MFCRVNLHVNCVSCSILGFLGVLVRSKLMTTFKLLISIFCSWFFCFDFRLLTGLRLTGFPEGSRSSSWYCLMTCRPPLLARSPVLNLWVVATNTGSTTTRCPPSPAPSARISQHRPRKTRARVSAGTSPSRSQNNVQFSGYLVLSFFIGRF